MKILSKLIEYGLIKEFNDWQSHFLAGTKGVPKTDPVILDYVKSLLEEVFPDQPDKVKNCRLAPWLVLVVRDLGVENIDTSQRNKMVDVAQWFKTTGTEGPFKNKDLNSAYEFVISKRTKETREQPKEDNDSGPYLQAERDGRIRKVGSVGDGRIWVEVIDPTWLGEDSELNPHYKWGVNCQNTSAHGFWSPSMLNVQLIGPPHGNPQGKWSTHIAIAGPRGTGDIKEIKQEGNQLPGSQKTSAGYSDGAEVIVNFLCSNPFAKQNFKRFALYHGGEPIQNVSNTYGGDVFLIYLAKPNTADLFNRLMDCRPDILENNRRLIVAMKGVEWFEERQMDIEEFAKRDPEGFLRKFERLHARYGKVAIEKLKDIDFNNLYNENKDLFKSSLPVLLGRIPANDFITLLNMVDIKEMISTNPQEFKEILKLMSNDKAYKESLKKIYDLEPEYFFSIFGKSTIGVIRFLSFAASPRLREHQNAIWDPKKEQYYVNKEAYKYNPDGSIIRDAAGNRVVDHIYKAWIPENLLVMDRKERRKFIEKNKDYIESLVKGNDFDKKISYLKILLPEVSEQEAKKMLETDNVKEQIIKYYDQKYADYIKDKQTLNAEKFAEKYGRRLQGAGSAPIVQNYEPGVLEFYRQFRIGEPENRKIPIPELLKNFNKIIDFYAQESMEKNKATKPIVNGPEDEKKLEAWVKSHQIIGFAKGIEKLKENGLSEEEVTRIINDSVKKSNLKTPEMVKHYFSRMLPLLSKSKAISELQRLKPLFDKMGYKGSQYHKDLLIQLSILKYNVSPGQRIMYLGNKDQRQRYNLTNEKMYLVIDVRNTYYDEDLEGDQLNDLKNIKTMNGEVCVTEDDNGSYGGQDIWVPTDRFKVSSQFELVADKLNESFSDFAQKFNNLKKTLIESDGKKPRYTAIMLDDNSLLRLENYIKELKNQGLIGEDWHISADHVTINLGAAQDATLLGQQINIDAVALGTNDKVAALKVSIDRPIDFKGRTPHITLAFNKNAGAKPVMSNDLKDWKNISVVKLKGTIQEVY